MLVIVDPRELTNGIMISCKLTLRKIHVIIVMGIVKIDTCMRYLVVCNHLYISEQVVYIENAVRKHYNDVIMGAMASQITSLATVYSSVYSDADQRKHQSSASLAFVWGIHRWPVNSPHKWPVTRKMFPFDDVIMIKPEEVIKKYGNYWVPV